MAKGVEWKPVKVTGLSKDMQTLHTKYTDAYEKASKLANQLKDGLRDEWDTRYPTGIDGKVCAFNVTGGKLQYVMKEKAKGATAGDGDDVFSHHPQRQ